MGCHFVSWSWSVYIMYHVSCLTYHVSCLLYHIIDHIISTCMHLSLCFHFFYHPRVQEPAPYASAAPWSQRRPRPPARPPRQRISGNRHGGRRQHHDAIRGSRWISVGNHGKMVISWNCIRKNEFLVGGILTPEKYEFVNWDDDIPHCVWKNKIHVPNHQPAYNSGDYFWWHYSVWNSWRYFYCLATCVFSCNHRKVTTKGSCFYSYINLCDSIANRKYRIIALCNAQLYFLSRLSSNHSSSGIYEWT